MNCTKNVSAADEGNVTEITHVSKCRDEALLVLHLQLVVLLVLTPTADIVKEGPDCYEMEKGVGREPDLSQDSV